MRRIAFLLTFALLAGCGPSAQTRRACEFYFHAGGSPRESESWSDYQSDWAFWNAARARGRNNAAIDSVAVRLGISRREVAEALAVCPAYTAK